MANEAGKGSGRRSNQVSLEVMASNWDRIFGKKDKNIDATIERYSEPVPDREYVNTWTSPTGETNGRCEEKEN